MIAHIKNYYDYCLSPNCPFIPEWKKQGEDYYREKMESLRFGREQFIPYLEQHTELTKEDETLLAEIMATESEWFRVPEEAERQVILISLENSLHLLHLLLAKHSHNLNHISNIDKTHQDLEAIDLYSIDLIPMCLSDIT